MIALRRDLILRVAATQSLALRPNGSWDAERVTVANALAGEEDRDVPTRGSDPGAERGWAEPVVDAGGHACVVATRSQFEALVR